jgi:arylsulfatase A-like enzyme
MRYNQSLTYLVLALHIPLVVSAANLAEQKQQPNVLFVISDDLRPELGCYGNKVIKSPNIDRLAARGMVFRRAYCQQAVCSPSRTSVMTGCRPDTTKVWDLRTHFRKAMPDVVTLPQCFIQNGYTARGFGKVYHSKLDDRPSWSDGKTHAFFRPAPKHTFASFRPQHDDIPLTKTDRSAAFRKTDDPPNGGGDGRVADQAIAALKQLKTDAKPFFLAVGFRKPHLPFNVPKVYWNMYEENKIPIAPNRFLPKNAPDFALVEQNELWKYSKVPDTANLPDDYARKLKHGYYASVSYMDAQLGRVLDELDRLKLTENTIIVLWGDHGWKLGEHNRWCKHSNFEDDTRSPLIISAPGTKHAGTKTEALTEFVDIYPTLVDLADLETPSHLEGKSLVPVLNNPTAPHRSAAFSQYPRTVNRQRLMGYSMRTDRYRYTRWLDRYDHSIVIAEELYDHNSDPQENANVVNEPQHRATVKKLAAAMHQWLTHDR